MENEMLYIERKICKGCLEYGTERGEKKMESGRTW